MGEERGRWNGTAQDWADAYKPVILKLGRKFIDYNESPSVQKAARVKITMKFAMRVMGPVVLR